MKISRILLPILLCYNIASSQNISSPLVQLNHKNKVLTFSRTLVNPGDSAAHFKIANMPYSDSVIVAFIQGFITNPADTEQSKLDLIQGMAAWEKSPRFTNTALVFANSGNDSSLSEKEYSPTGMAYSFYSTQCGDYVTYAFLTLLKTGFFKLSDFMTCSVPGHTYCQIKLWNYFTFVDFDPGEYGFMYPNTNSPNGWASIFDIKSNPNLVTSQYLYQGMPLISSSHTRSEYLNLICGNSLDTFSQILYKNVALYGDFILPAKGQIEIKSPGNFLFYDSTNAASVSEFSTLVGLVYELASCTSCCQQCIYDSLTHTMIQFFEVDSAKAFELLNSGICSAIPYDGNSTNQTYAQLLWNKFAYLRDSLPVWNVEFTNTDTVYTGIDIKAPMLIVDVNSKCNLGDTVVSSPTQLTLWSTDTVPPLVTANEVNYLQQGLFPPGIWTISLASNANLLDAFSALSLSGDSLAVNTQVLVLNPDTTTTTAIAVQEEGPSFQIFPNPVHSGDKFFVSEKCDVYSLAGDYLGQIEKGTSTASLPAGVYILWAGEKRREIVVQ